MSMPISAATNAYAQAQKLIDRAGKAAPQQPDVQAPGNNFGALVAENVQATVDVGKTSDKMSMDLVNGKGNLVDVVTAMAETEIAIESMVAIRDRVIKAYEEIMRMPI